MRIIRSVLIIFLVLFVQLTLAGGEPKFMEHISKKDAQALARKSFLDTTKNSIPKYKIKSVDDPDDQTTWRFLFQGAEQYAKPGHHVLIIINKRTRQIEVMQGE